MGYVMQQVDCDFRIPVARHVDALNALKELATRSHLAWVTDPSQWLNLAYALEGCRFEPRMDAGYNVVGVEFIGEKLGDERAIFNAIAPYVKHQSYIEMLGEDGDRWRWLFVNGMFVEQEGRVVWSKIN